MDETATMHAMTETPNYPSGIFSRVRGNKKAGSSVVGLPAALFFAEGYGCSGGSGIFAAAMMLLSRLVMYSTLSTPSGRWPVRASHFSSENEKLTAMHPGAFLGAMIFSTIARLAAGIGRCFFPSQLSTVRLLTWTFSAKSARDVPVSVSHCCRRSFNMASVYAFLRELAREIREKCVKEYEKRKKKSKKRTKA